MEVKVKHRFVYFQNLSFDPDSEIFKSTFERWKKANGYEEADIEEMLLDVGLAVIFNGMRFEIENIGFLAKDGEPFGQPFSGIEILNVNEDETGKVIGPIKSYYSLNSSK